MAELESGNRLSHLRSGNVDSTVLRKETKSGISKKERGGGITHRAKGRLKPLHVGMGCILLVIGVLPFANMITVRQFVHDHPILSFAEESIAEEVASVSSISAEGSKVVVSDWSPPPQTVSVYQEPLHVTDQKREETNDSVNHNIKPPAAAATDGGGVSVSLDRPKSILPSDSSQIMSTSTASPLKKKAVDKIDQIEADGIFGSFLDAFGISSKKDSSKVSSSTTSTVSLNSRKSIQKQTSITSLELNEIKPSTTPCKEVFLFIAAREDSYEGRELYRSTWLNPQKWAPVKGKVNPLAEELPSIAYRFFIVENESELDNSLTRLSPNTGASTASPASSDPDKNEKLERKAGVLTSDIKKEDVVLIPTNGKKRYGVMSPTMVRSWIMSWVLKHAEFRFLMVLDLGKSSPILEIPLTPAEIATAASSGVPLSISNKGRVKKKDFDKLRQSSSSSSHTKIEGTGYTMVCVERIADELRYRPNERFFWGTQTCGENTPQRINQEEEEFDGGDDENMNFIGFPQHPKFQLFSQDVVELLTLAESKLLDSSTGDASSLMSSDALLAALKLTLLDDRLRIQDVSSSSLLMHAKSAVVSAKTEFLRNQHSAGHINGTVYRSLQQELQLWSQNEMSDDKGDGASSPKPSKKKKASGPEPVCRLMTMLTGLSSVDDLKALEASNTNRTKPWKQYRDQIMRLSPACDAATTFEDVGLTTDKTLTSSSSSSSSSSLSSEGLVANNEATSMTAKVELAYAFLDNDELFDDEERFALLQKCSIHADCLWREITTTAVERWWHTVDGQRAGRCYRADTHSKGATCDAFKSRKFLTDALVESKDSKYKFKSTRSHPDTAGVDGDVTLENGVEEERDGSSKNHKGKVMKRKQESGQKAVVKSHASGAVLASFPGSGNTWSRMLLEYASGYYTGSIYNDITLMPVLPAEGVRTHEVLAWKAHTFPSQYIDNYQPAKVVLLVRHPISALWSEFQRRLNVEAGSRGGGGHVAAVKQLSAADKNNFKSWSSCMSCRWIQYITAHLQLAQVLPLKILLFERLAVDTVNAMREVLQFLGVNDIDEERLLCATRLADHPLVHRPPANFTMHDAFKSFPEQACSILRTIEQTDQGRLIMRLLGYGNNIKPPKVCDAYKDDVFSCTNMLVDEFHGSKQCKVGTSSSVGASSVARAPPPQISSGGGGMTTRKSTTITPSKGGGTTSGGAWKTRATTVIGGDSRVSKPSGGDAATKRTQAARAKYEASKLRNRT